MFFFLFHARLCDDHGIHNFATMTETDKRIDINGLDKVRAGGCDLGEHRCDSPREGTTL